MDPGSVKMGYGVVTADAGLISYVAAGVISAPASWGKQRRLVELFKELEDVLAEYTPDVAGIEAGFVKGQMGALTSGAARGIALLALGRRGIDATEYPPTTVKKVAAGYGAAQKGQVARMVQVTLHMNKEPEPDAADALAVALCRARDRA